MTAFGISHRQRLQLQNVFQLSNGEVSSTHNGVPAVTDKFSYPFNINFTVLNPSGSQCTFLTAFLSLRRELIFLPLAHNDIMKQSPPSSTTGTTARSSQHPSS